MRFLPILLLYLHHGAALKVATSLAWIEHTPQPYAIKNFYKGSSSATLTSGGVANLGTDKSFDLAANAETQGLKQYASHRKIRLIYIVCEVAYRIVADRSKGIKSLADLKGKKIGSIKGTSAAIFVEKMMRNVGVKEGEYTVVNVCMKTPCASNTLPSQLKSGAIDAFGVWEPAVELGAQTLGPNAVIFQNASIYREVYALYSTTEALDDPKRRKDIVEFVRALNKTLDVFANEPKKAGVYDFVAKEVGMDASVVEAVWDDHKWSGRWDDKELLDFLVEEDTYLAQVDKRTPVPRKELQNFLDTSVLDEL
ncbi:periplasmic binding protein-like II [Cucurbitaria berberidis CBS 394.84]|uniref:Periplasmic binding protein-like II n=1 Tax=Cucurbitaria berberidis CBS 394.84 TaxID=1168544 RepID=A0A9P4LBD0_9PLEO|nr:periplasmic binding protein-like II [Cucurbitaria berberidis CBS 394.84]KAF1848393.1 periplasmic binding protein-like II [Cucurbitaria berberidis CBS 394.84]